MKKQKQTKEEMLARKAKHYQFLKDEENFIKSSLGIYKGNALKHKHKQIKMLDKITDLWRTTGMFNLPDEKIIDKEIEKEELLYEDTVDEITLEECIENNDENNDY